MVLISSTTEVKAYKPVDAIESTGTTNTTGNIPLSSSVGENIDELNTSGTTSQQETKRTSKQLYEAIASICLENGLDINEAKSMGLLSIISGKTETELLNVEQTEITKVVQKIKDAINAIKEDIPAIKNGTEKLTFDLIKNYVKLLNGEVPKGWDSVDSFRKAQKKNGATSLSTRLEKYFNLKKGEIKSLSTAELADKLERYFDYHFQILVKSKKNTREEVDNLQLTDFTKLLFNSSPEEYDMFRDAIEYLVSNNRHKGYEAILESFDNDAQRTEFANKTTYKQVQTWNTKADQRGEVPSAKIAALNTAAALKWKDAEHIEEYHETASKEALEFYSDEENLTLLKEVKNNPKIIPNIQEKLVIIERVEYIKRKIENKEDISNEERAFLEANANVALTDEEKKYLDVYAKDRHFRGDNAGQIIGVGTNNIIEQDAKKELLTTINYDAYKVGEKAGEDFYREVLSTVVNYKNTLSEEDKIAFENLMKDTIGENYTKVDNDIANGTTSELTPPTSSRSNEVETTSSTPSEVVVPRNDSSIDPRYSSATTIDFEKPNSLKSNLYNEEEEEEPITPVLVRTAETNTSKNEEEAARGGLKAVKAFAKATNTSYLEVALNLLDFSNLSELLKTWAFARFDNLNNGQKARFCNNIKNNQNKMEAGNLITSISALEQVNCTNGLVAQHFEERIEELREQQA